MRDRPTFFEFLFYSRKVYIKTRSGAYYTAANARKIQSVCLWLTMAYIVIVTTIWIFSIPHVQLWPNRIADFLLLLNVGNLLCFYPRYRFTRFDRVPENSEAYAAASALKYPSKVNIICIWILGAIYLLLALHSTGVAYVRYWLLDGGARITRADINIGGHDMPLPLAQEALSGDAPVIQIPTVSGSPSVSVNVTTSGSPEPLQLFLDDEPARVYEPLDFRWFWDADYFVQCGYIRYADVRDGSTLTLTCGDLVREWVFDVADEEAS